MSIINLCKHEAASSTKNWPDLSHAMPDHGLTHPVQGHEASSIDIFSAMAHALFQPGMVSSSAKGSHEMTSSEHQTQQVMMNQQKATQSHAGCQQTEAKAQRQVWTPLLRNTAIS